MRTWAPRVLTRSDARAGRWPRRRSGQQAPRGGAAGASTGGRHYALAWARPYTRRASGPRRVAGRALHASAHTAASRAVKARAELESMASAHAPFADAVAMLRALVLALDGMTTVLPPGVPDDARARARLGEGVPALYEEPLLDGEAFRDQLARIAAALSAAQGAPDAVAMVAARVSELSKAARQELAEQSLTGAWWAMAALARRMDVDEHAFITACDMAARPALRAGRAALIAPLNDARWERGICPGCGAPPLLAELRGAEGERVLRCGRCAAAWRAPRLACIACGSHDHARLTALHGAGEEAYRRADCCDACGAYLKAVAVLDPLTAAELLETDLATAALDLAAVDAGYSRTSRDTAG